MNTHRRHLAHNVLLSSLLTAAMLLGAGCGKQDSAATAKGGGQAIPVQAGQARRQTLPLIQVSVGTIQAERSVAVKSQVDGVIRQVHFKEGSTVKAGDPLITLDRRPFENALQIAKADLANARAELDRAEADAIRYEQLEKTQNVSIEMFKQFTTKRETSRAMVMAKEAAVANAELQLSYASIQAPISGLAGQLSLHEGSLVKANDANNVLVTINQVDPIEVAYSVPEKILPQVRLAAAAGPVTVRITAQAANFPVHTGMLSFIDNNVDTTTGTILLKAEFANADGSLWPGQFVQIETELGSDKDVLVVPSGAIQVGQQGTQIFVISEDKTVDIRPIKAGRSLNGLTIVAGEIKEGEKVVTDGHLRLTPKARVEIRTLEEAAAGKAPAAAKQPKS